MNTPVSGGIMKRASSVISAHRPAASPASVNIDVALQTTARSTGSGRPLAAIGRQVLLEHRPSTLQRAS